MVKKVIRFFFKYIFSVLGVRQLSLFDRQNLQKKIFFYLKKLSVGFTKNNYNC